MTFLSSEFLSSPCASSRRSASKKKLNKKKNKDMDERAFVSCDMLITENAWTHFGKIPRCVLGTLLPGGWNMQFPEGGSTGYRSMEHGILAFGVARPPEVTRTMVGLRNLQVFRGEQKTPNLDLQSMMVGPCHFYGTLPCHIGVTSYKFVLPAASKTLERIDLGDVTKPQCTPIYGSSAEHTKRLLLEQHRVSAGKTSPPKGVSFIGTFSEAVRPTTTLTAGYNNTGIFLVESSTPECVFETLDASQYDLEPFGVQIVKNGDEFAIPGILCDQDDLQLITYWWGENYLDHCIAHDDGAFLETHDFPQTITPLSEDCGGHLLLARPVTRDATTTVEVIAVHIPYGCTAILGKNSWHGDMGLKGLHLMAMTANHLIMEGTTKSWFLKHDTSNPETAVNLEYRVQYGAGSREYIEAQSVYQAKRQARALGQMGVTQMLEGERVSCPIPGELEKLVSCADSFPYALPEQGVRHERWGMYTDESIRKYAPWSTPSSERVAVAQQDAKLFRKHSAKATQLSEAERDEVYIEHQHDLAHRFQHGAVQLFDERSETVGPMSPFWMLRMPRRGHWRYVIGRVVGRTLAGTESFMVEDVWSDSTVGDLLERVNLRNRDVHYSVVSSGQHSDIVPYSEVLLTCFPDPEIAHDGVSELTVTVVAQQREDDKMPIDDDEYRGRGRPTISLFFGLIQFQK